MLSQRYLHNGKPFLPMTDYQLQMKAVVDGKVQRGEYPFEPVPCAVCRGQNFEKLSEKDRYGLYMPVVICRDCGLMQTNPRMTQAAYKEFYNQEYRKLYSGHETPEELFKSHQITNHSFYEFIESSGYLPRERRGCSVLDVGCGAGHLVSVFQRNGFIAQGIDLGREYLDFGRRTMGLQLHEGTIHDVQFAEKFNVIVYHHSFEHVLDPVGDLRRVSELLSEEGLLCIEVPGIKFLYRTYDLSWYLQNAHVYHYSLRTMTNLLGQNGFKLCRGTDYIQSVFIKDPVAAKGFVVVNDFPETTKFLRHIEFWHRILPSSPWEMKNKAIAFLKWLKIYPLLKKWYGVMKERKSALNRKRSTRYCVLVEHRSLIGAYAWYAFLTGKQLLIFGEKDPGLPGFLKGRVSFQPDTIAAYPGQWYRINREMVEQSDYLRRLELEKNAGIRWQSFLFRTPKVVNFYKHHLSQIEYKLKRDIFLTQQQSGEVKFLAPHLRSYRLALAEYFKPGDYETSLALNCFFILTGWWSCLRKIIAGLIFKPVFRPKLKAALLKRCAWGFANRDLQDDMLVDGQTVFAQDMLFFTDRGTTKGGERVAAEEAKKRNYRVLELGREFNVNDRLWKHLRNNIAGGLAGLAYNVLFNPSCLLAAAVFHDKAFYNYKLYSFTEASTQWSIGIWHDIVETVVANDCNSRMFVYHWADSAQCYAYGIALTVQNDMFLWGPVMTRLQHKRSLHDNFYGVGCLFTNSYTQLPGEEIRRQLGLPDDRKVVVFYDSPPNDAARFSQREFDGFLQLTKDFALAHPHVQVVLKPKEVTGWYQDYFKGAPVRLWDARQVRLGDIVRAADLNVGIGIVAPVVVGLMMHRPGIFFDAGGNYDSPLSKYEGSLVFRNREDAWRQMEGCLNGSVHPVEVPELAEYNIPGVDPIAVLRRYVKTGTVDERYRLNDEPVPSRVPENTPVHV